jgi:excisionase family DNA binding protein
MPFAQRLTCTIDDACEVTGLGRTKLYELIGAGRIVTTTIGRRRLVVVRSLLVLLDTNISRLPDMTSLTRLAVPRSGTRSARVKPCGSNR